MMMKYNCQSAVGTIESILLKHPKNVFKSQGYIDKSWEGMNYLGPPDFEKTLREYEEFLTVIEGEVPEVFFLPEDKGTGLDSIYVHDPFLVTQRGAILCNMGKKERQGEPAAAGKYLKHVGVPILGEITGEGRLEGGDVVWLDEKTMAVGLGYRSNQEAVRQLRQMSKGLFDIIEVHLPHWTGEADCLHLMSMLSLVDKDLAVVYSPLMSVPFRQLLLLRGIKFIEVSQEEYDNLACNVLPLAPRRCLIMAGNPRIRRALENEGVEVFEYPGENLSLKGCGGPTCLTRPIYRR